MDALAKIAFVAAMLICFAVGCAIGASFGHFNAEREQIEAGRAYWWCDPQTGAKELKWKEVCK